MALIDILQVLQIICFSLFLVGMYRVNRALKSPKKARKSVSSR